MRMFLYRRTQSEAVMDKGKPHGLWSLIVSNPGDVIVTLADAFGIESAS